MKDVRIIPARYMEPAKIAFKCFDGEFIIECQQYSLPLYSEQARAAGDEK